MMMIEFELIDLRSFVAVARERSFSRAARRLLRTQPTVTMAVQRLERRAGHLLLERSSRGVSLTPEGALLLAEAAPVLDRWEALPARFRQALSGEVAGTVRVAADEAAALHLLPPVIRPLLKWNPAVSLDVRVQEGVAAFEALRTGEADVVLAAAETPPDGLETLAVFRSERLLLFPGHHPLASTPRPSLKALALERLLLPPKGTATRAAVDCSFRRAGLLPVEAGRAAGWEMVRAYSGLGLGVGVAPSCILQGIDRRLAVRKAGSLFGHELFVLARRKGESLGSAARAFAERAVAHLGHLAESSGSRG